MEGSECAGPCGWGESGSPTAFMDAKKSEIRRKTLGEEYEASRTCFGGTRKRTGVGLRK